MSTVAHFAVQTATNGQTYFSLIAPNGEKILASELYLEKRSALKGIESVKENAPDAGRFEKKADVQHKPFFVLKAKNGEIIGKSQSYSSEATRDHGIAAVQQYAPTAVIEDHSGAT